VKKILALICGILGALNLKGQDSTTPKFPFASIYGTTGIIHTPNTSMVGKFNGNIGVFENFRSDSLDQLVFCFGVHPNIEVGIQSEIPTQPNPRMHFFFKIQGFQQGRLFGLRSKYIPSTAFAMQKNGAFAIAGYAFRSINFSGGYGFSDFSQGVFANVSFQPIKYAALQSEYLDDSLGLGLRSQYRGIELSVVYRHGLGDEEFRGHNAYWRIAYNFQSGSK
jgi:hypothetical protein